MNIPNLAETYRMLADSGCGFIKVTKHSKKPAGQTWQFISADDAVKRLETGTGNVGVNPRGNVFIIDLDGDDAAERFGKECEKLPEFDTFIVETPNGYHVYFLANEPDKLRMGNKTYWGKGVDIRPPNTKCQVIGPGSYVKATDPKKNSGYYKPYSPTVVPIAQCPMVLEELSRKAQRADNRNEQAAQAVPAAHDMDCLTAVQSPVQNAVQGAVEPPVAHGTKPSLQSCKNKVTRFLRKIAESQPGDRNQDDSDYASAIGGYVAHYRDEFESMDDTPLERILSAVRKTFTDDDSDSEKAKHIETATRRYNEGLEQPLYVDDKNSSETNEPAQFLNVCELMNYKARLNLERDSEEWYFADESTWRALKPHEKRMLFARIWNEHEWNVKAQDRDNLLTFVASQLPCYPYRDVLRTYHNYYDPDLEDVPIEHSFHWWIVNPGGEYEQWCQKAVWGQMVSRIMADPQAQRTVVTFRGPAESGKSICVEKLLPDELGGVGKLSLSEHDRDVIVLLKDHYAVEFPELGGMSKRLAADVKRIIGSNGMYIRILRTTESMKVKFTAAIIGTANEEPTLYNDPALIERFAYLDWRKRLEKYVVP